MGTQFESVAAAVYKRALEAGLGYEVPDDYFLQDVRD